MQDHLQYLSILEEQPEKNILKEIRLSAKDNCRKLHTLVKQKARSSAKNLDDYQVENNPAVTIRAESNMNSLVNKVEEKNVEKVKVLEKLQCVDCNEIGGNYLLNQQQNCFPMTPKAPAKIYSSCMASLNAIEFRYSYCVGKEIGQGGQGSVFSGKCKYLSSFV